MRQPRPRAELEKLIREQRAGIGDSAAKAKRLLEEIDQRRQELLQLRDGLVRYQNQRFELQWEYFERLSLDGAIQGLPPLEVDVSQVCGEAQLASQ